MLLTTYRATAQRRSWVENPRYPRADRDTQITARIRSKRGATHDIRQSLAGRKSSVGCRQRHGGTAASTNIAVNSDDLRARRSLSHADSVRVRVDRPGLVRQIRRVLRDGPAANRVEARDPRVQCRAGIVP